MKMEIQKYLTTTVTKELTQEETVTQDKTTQVKTTKTERIISKTLT